MDLPPAIGMPEHSSAVLRQFLPLTIASWHSQMLGNHFKCFLVLNLLETDDVRIAPSIYPAQALQDFEIGSRRHVRREWGPLEPESIVTEYCEWLHLIILLPDRNYSTLQQLWKRGRFLSSHPLANVCP